MQVEFWLLSLSLLFLVSIFTDRISYRLGVPALLLFLGVGMLFGPEGIGFTFNDTNAAEAFGTVAMCIILFSGGMDTKISDIQPVAGPGITLATLGVLITATVTGVIIWLVFGWLGGLATISLPMALLMASTMSSTDSASVFSILRTQNIGLKHNLRPMLELESGANDPMAYVLTTTLIGIVLANTGDVTALTVVQDIFIQLVVGLALGFIFGRVVIWLMRKVQLNNESLYPLVVLTACIFIFAVTYYMKGNSYLAVYIGGLIIGNNKFTRKRQTKAFFDGLTWLSQLMMFLILGLLVQPSQLIQLDVLLPCLIISMVMILVSRPISVFLCLIPFPQYDKRDAAFLSWVGLKGAVPIIFAIMCRAEGVPMADMIFNIVFLCTLLSLLIQGTSLSGMARRLNLATEPVRLRKLRHFDLDLPDEIQSSATELEVTDAMLEQGNRLKDLHIPRQTLVIMVRRDEDFFVPTGQSELLPGDQLLLITDDDAALAEQYMTAERQEEAEQWQLQLLTNTASFIKQKVASVFNKDKNTGQTRSSTDGRPTVEP